MPRRLFPLGLRPASALSSNLVLVLVLVLALAEGRVLEELRPGSVCYANDTLRSPNGVFELGLVSPGASKSVYLGIWYSRIKPRTIVWVANRNNPIAGGQGGFYTLDSGGQLRVRNQGRQILWSSDTARSNAARAVLLDTGNLVLETAAKNRVWQSFDHPGNTWLPYLKMGLDKNLRSWVSPEDPSEGPFSLRMANTTEFVSRWRNQKQYWSSGPWEVQQRAFRFVPQMTSEAFYNFSFENYTFTWNPYNSTKFVSHFIMDTDGAVKQVSLSPSDGDWASFWTEPEVPCDVYALCGSFGVCGAAVSTSLHCSCPLGFSPTNRTRWGSQVWLDGCQPNAPLDCVTDEFVELNQTTFDLSSVPYSTPTVSNATACMNACKSNCSCLGFYYNPFALNCSLFFDGLLDGKASSDVAGSFYLRVPIGMNKASVGTKLTNYKLIVGISIAIAIIFVLVSVGFAIVARKRRWQTRRESFPPGLLRIFSYRELQTATKNFAESLGSGGFGYVFKGCLHDGTELGVKKLNWLRQGEKQFRVEVSTIGTIQHVNLVCLIGFACEGKHRLLAYEYMPNGSLERWLFHKKETIDWASRYHIALGTARGIAYLHEECRHQIIHCDIKPENILLDVQFNAKVSDFGLAKILGKEFSRVLTTLRGTRGYLAPEWLAGSPLTSKVDVYSYGMTILEIISGRRNLDHVEKNKQVNDKDDKKRATFFPVLAIEQMIQGNFLSLVDDRIKDGVDIDQLRKVAFVAGWCIQDEEESRPSMKNVVDMLEGTIDVNDPPIPNSLQSLTSNYDEED